eukprot:5883169-Prymnesium_polylepis.1
MMVHEAVTSLECASRGRHVVMTPAPPLMSHVDVRSSAGLRTPARRGLSPLRWLLVLRGGGSGCKRASTYKTQH